VEELPFRIPKRRAPARKPEPPDPGRKRRVALAAGLSLLWTIFTLLAQFSGVLDEIEEPLIDWRLALVSHPEHPSDQLALITIDQIPATKPWPWSRLDYSLTLRSLIDYAPQSVVFDMNLNDRDTDYTAFDTMFSHVVERANTVVFAATVLSPRSPLPIPPRIKSIPFHGDTRSVPHYGSAIWPLSTFAGESPVGANNVEAEPDLHLRRLPMVFMLDNKMVPSLTFQAAAQYLGADLSASDVILGRAIFLRRHDGKILRTLPIDEQGRMRVRFRTGGPASWQATFNNIPLYDEQILNHIPPGKDMRQLVNRQVWIGRTDPALHERFETPVGQLSRVEIELQAMRTILEQDYIRPLPPMILAALYLLVGIGAAAMVVRIGPLHAAALLLIVASFWFESAILTFRLYNVVLPLPSFLMLLFGTYIMGLLAAFWDLEPETDSRQIALEL
jgi:adenylate cyclase